MTQQRAQPARRHGWVSGRVPGLVTFAGLELTLLGIGAGTLVAVAERAADSPPRAQRLAFPQDTSERAREPAGPREPRPRGWGETDVLTV